MAQLSDDASAFGRLLTVEDVQSLILERFDPVTSVETVGLGEADGRVLAHDLLARHPLPPFDNSAVDGFAVRFADLSETGATKLTVQGRVPAGATAAHLETRGVAVRVFTGAPMPPGADTVFMQEDVTVEAGTVTLPPGLAKGANTRLAGEDIHVGAVALPKGRRLGPSELALAAAVGSSSIEVRTRLRVGVFSTGDELVDPGQPLGEAQIHDANRHMLLALAARLGTDPIDLGILRDEPRELADALRKAAARCDLILTSGGVSTGEEDHVKAAVEAAGSLDFWRLGIKPGRPVAMGEVGGKAFVGLPGNPVAVFVTFAAVVAPLAARLSGAEPPRRWRIPVVLGFDYRKKPGRREYVRVTLHQRPDGRYEARKHAQDGAGVITSLTATDGLLELPDDVTRLSAGDTVPFLSWRELF